MKGQRQLLCKAERGLSELAGRGGRVAPLCACAAAERSGPSALTHPIGTTFLQARG